VEVAPEVAGGDLARGDGGEVEESHGSLRRGPPAERLAFGE
jgi:hypothetical protein